MPIMQRTAKTPAPSFFGLPTLNCGDPPPTPSPASSTHISSGVFIPLFFLLLISAIPFHLRNMPSLLIYQTNPKRLPTQTPVEPTSNPQDRPLHPSSSLPPATLQKYPILPTANLPHLSPSLRHHPGPSGTRRS